MNQQTTAVATQANMFAILDQNIQQAFQSNPVKNKDGAEIGFSVTMRKDKEFGELVQLPGKLNKESRVEEKLKRSDALFTLIKGEIAKLNGEWTGKAIKLFTPKSGEREVVIRLKEVKRSTIVSEEKLAIWMFPDVQYPAMTMAEKLEGVKEARKRQEAHLASNVLDAGAAE